MPFCPEGKTAVNPCFKYFVLFGALIHWLIAVAMIGVGAWAVEEGKAYYLNIEDVYDILSNIAIMFIIIGCIMCIINTCGFVGALRENTILLRIFYIALLIIFLLEIVGGVLAIVFKDKVLEIFSRVLKEVYVEEYQDDKDGIMDYFQEKFECCGVDSYTDWNANMYYNCTDGNPSQIKCSVPFSCCITQDEFTTNLVNILCGQDVLAENSGTLAKIHTAGCLPSIVAIAEQNLILIGGICIAIAVPQLLGIFLGKRLVEQINYQWREYKRYQQRRGSGGHGQGQGRRRSSGQSRGSRY